MLLHGCIQKVNLIDLCDSASYAQYYLSARFDFIVLAHSQFAYEKKFRHLQFPCSQLFEILLDKHFWLALLVFNLLKSFPYIGQKVFLPYCTSLFSSALLSQMILPMSEQVFTL